MIIIRECFCCGIPLRSCLNSEALGEDEQGREFHDFQNPPLDAIVWTAVGNFGTSLYDPQPIGNFGSFLEISICDDCTKERMGRILFVKQKKTVENEVKVWEGENE